MKSFYKINNFGDKYWFLGLHLHRADGPAVEWADGSKKWCLNGKLHREDGPAVEWASGDKEWYLHGKLVDCKDNEEFLRMIKLMVFL